MSAASAWSYTSKATHWARTGRDDWRGVDTFAVPVSFDCDYKAESVRMTNDRGQEFLSRQRLYTEKSDIKLGDRVLIGTHTNADPIAAGAAEVQRAARYADTFDGVRDDYEVAT